VCIGFTLPNPAPSPRVPQWFGKSAACCAFAILTWELPQGTKPPRRGIDLSVDGYYKLAHDLIDDSSSGRPWC
jgi:hypothetical protein